MRKNKEKKVDSTGVANSENAANKKKVELKDVAIIPDMDFYTIEIATLKIGLENKATLERAIKNKEIKATVKNRQRIIFHSDLIEYIKG